MKRKVVKVKAWVVLNKSREIIGAITHEWKPRNKGFSVLPCTITYEVPERRENEDKK